ncbi:hypothetical protein ABT336_14620 [Micromonospora sp. NPDC000207]|uniref:hypothetical protein n=1 Tax=Micromonospora sp. NPDC000207 TaxID=3154246 RepID=UPI00332DBCEB
MFDLRIRLGSVLRIEAADRYRPSDGPVTVWVTGVRLVLNRPERDEWVWVEGIKIGDTSGQGTQTQILIRASRLPNGGPVR